MTFCILLQGVTLFPHHHHPGQSAICYNIAHCVEPHADFRDHDGCTQSKSCSDHYSMQPQHTHDTNHSTSCTATKLLIIKPQNESKSGVAPLALLLLGGGIPSVRPLTTCAEQYIGTILLNNIEDNEPFVTSINLTYIAKVCSLRAPNILS